jgi:hypothetical protein
MNTTINALIFFFLVMSMGYLAPLLDDHGDEHEVAKAELAKQSKQDRFERAAREMCGNGVALVDPSGAVICKVRKALKAGKAKL